VQGNSFSAALSNNWNCLLHLIACLYVNQFGHWAAGFFGCLNYDPLATPKNFLSAFVISYT